MAAMLRLTFDWNCLIEVEERRAQADAVLSLVQAHRQRRCEVALLATSASENTRSRLFPGNAHLFKARVGALGLGDLPIVLAPGIIGLTYIDWSFMVDEAEYNYLKPSLWAAMFPMFQSDPKDHLAAGERLDDTNIQSDRLANWRNRWCDVMSAYSHIHAARDVFVTLNVRDFQNNSSELMRLGMGKILTPTEALTRI